MVDLNVEFAGLRFRNPIFTAAGPAARDGMTLLNAAAGGAGGLVAKTVSVTPAEVPRPNMAAVLKGRVGSRRGMLNAELWSELPIEQWLEKEESNSPEEMAIMHMKMLKFMKQFVSQIV